VVFKKKSKIILIAFDNPIISLINETKKGEDK